MPRPTDDELDFTGGFAAYKPPAGTPEQPAVPLGPAGHGNLDQASARVAQALSQQGYHLLAARESRGERGPRSVFLVDPDAAVAAQATKTLATAGIQLFVARDARTASRMLSKSAAPGMFLVNVALPGGVDGFALLKLLRKHPALGAVPVVLLTPPDARGDIIRGLMGGADGYLAKGLHPEGLLGITRAVLGNGGGRSG
jgi:CheY-like chemotaxis protein